MLTVLGEQGKWWRVRQADQVGWVPAADVTVVEPPTRTVIKAWEALGATHRQGSLDLVAGLLAADVERQATLARQERLSGIRAAFDAELKKDNDAREFGPIEASLKTFSADLPEDSPLVAWRRILRVSWSASLGSPQRCGRLRKSTSPLRCQRI